MRIEAEVDSSLRAFTPPERAGGGGCSVERGSLPPTAQDAKRSIDRSVQPPSTEQQQSGCGPERSDRPLTSSVFDCEHFQFIDEDEDDAVEDETSSVVNGTTGPADPVGRHLEEVSSGMSDCERNASTRRQASVDDASRSTNGETKRELRSVLKKGKTTRHRGRITFNEAVKLYSDEREGVQLLALTTGPDIVYPEDYYPFDPPIEYQDVPPFEPPAEYRDERKETKAPDQPEKQPVVEEPKADTQPVVANGDSEPPSNSSDVVVDKGVENAHVEVTEPEQPKTESTEESDKLFERFLEAEREFAVDEELNNVFHVLENDFAGDGGNGAFDDNFFRKLINLLSSVEGDVPVEDTELFSSTTFTNAEESKLQELEEDDLSQTHSRTLSEADSDCSISSQDTIIVRLGEEDAEQCTDDTTNEASGAVRINNNSEPLIEVKALSEPSETFDEVFNETKTGDISVVQESAEEKPRPLPRESLLKSQPTTPAAAKPDKSGEENLSRQSSSEQSASGNSQEPLQDADDSTSSDSRSGEVEEEIRLDDIGYDEEDAEDYDEESFRGMAHGNSKIRRIIKKNALQCTLFRGIEAKRRQQPGAKYPRPKSPLLSQESLVEKLKWLTTIDEHKDHEQAVNFHSKPPDVILSTGGMPVNGNIPNSASSEDDIGNQVINYSHPQMYPMQQRHVVGPNGQSYYVRSDGFPPSHHPSLPRQRMTFPGQHPPIMQHNLPSYQVNRTVAHPPSSHPPWPSQHQRPMNSMTLPRNFRDWRVIQRVMVGRNNDQSPNSRSQVAVDYVRCPNGTADGFPSDVPPDVSRTSKAPTNNKDELEQFVEQDSKRIERVRKRYSLAEEDDDPTFGFARRPSVRGVQNPIRQTSMNPQNPSDGQPVGFNQIGKYQSLDDSGQGPSAGHARSVPYSGEQIRMWNRDLNWRPDGGHPYGPPQRGERTQVPMHIHRASVALTELPGSATIPHMHRKSPTDTRYHSYAESMYGSTRTLPTNVWIPPDARTFLNVQNSPAGLQAVQTGSISGPMLQVPTQHPVTTSDERGVPEGASSSPKISSDSLYHPEAMTSGGQHKDDGMIYYSLNV